MEVFMSSLVTGSSSVRLFIGNPDVSFCFDGQNHLSVTMDTEQLHITSVESKDCDDYVSLFGDAEVMGKYATCQTKTREETEKRVNDSWVARWHNNDPYSGLAVFKNDTDEFVGHVVLGYGDQPGQAELAYLFKKAHWGKGYGKETVTAVVREYAPALFKQGYLLEGKSLETITACARPDIPAAIKILEKVGMHKTGEGEKYGALRHHFAIELSAIMA
jgi:ribosomal-protein-alanine N-acetyltransferase